MNSQYKFVTEGPEIFEFNPDKHLYSFYQVCQFRNNYSKKYEVRKVVFDQNGEIIKTFEKGYPKSKLSNFLKIQTPQKYALYPVANLSLIDLPNPNNLFGASSELLNA